MTIVLCTVRFISIYCPHAGCPLSDLANLYEELELVLDEARRQCFRIILGGDFNTVLNVGDRGAMLNEIRQNFSLRVSNDPAKLSEAERWTFRSSMGITRQIDYIFASPAFGETLGRSTDAIHLGSDHRAVIAEFYLETRRRIE